MRKKLGGLAVGWKEPEIGSSPLVARLIRIRANSQEKKGETDLKLTQSTKTSQSSSGLERGETRRGVRGER